MGYACPVCEDPQADGEHLANHLAFTAMLGDDAHEAWLYDHAPEWGKSDPESLAERVVDHAEEREFPQVFEDATGRDRGDKESHDHGRDPDTEDFSGGIDADVPDGESVPSDVLAEARELTRERREARRSERSGEGSGTTDEDG